jgi:hypothetical protein
MEAGVRTENPNSPAMQRASEIERRSPSEKTSPTNFERPAHGVKGRWPARRRPLRQVGRQWRRWILMRGDFFDLGQWNTLDVIRKLGTPY